jgi:TolA-binding protein
LASNQRASLEGRLKKAEENLELVQQQADAATAQRTELEAQLKEAQEKAVLAQKIADLVAAQARPEENGTPKSEAAAKNGNSANSPRSGRALPLDTGRNPDPGTSTQPLTHPVPSPHH